MTVLVGILLTVSVLAVAVSVVGVLVARDALDRLHYLGPASLVGGGALVVAVAVEAGWSPTTARTAAIVVLVVLLGPVLAHATARAAMVRGDVERLRGDDLQVDR